MAADMAALKDWVTAADSQQFSRLPEGVVSVNISHSNITARMIELKFELSQTVRATQSPLRFGPAVSAVTVGSFGVTGYGRQAFVVIVTYPVDQAVDAPHLHD